MREFVAVDAGGTSTRAVVVDETGRRLGAGRAESGNPTSGGASRAAAAVAAAVEAALGGRRGDGVAGVLVAHAGATANGYRDAVSARLAAAGVAVPVGWAGDLAALFASGTHEPSGAALIAGTGAIGGAIEGGALVRVVDGTGWLLGDAGSGFWIGHRVARAAADDLDGGTSTELTAAVLAHYGIAPDRAVRAGRPAALADLVAAVYAERPVRLAALAPLAFAAPGDAVAGRLVRQAAEALAALLTRVRASSPDGPLVFGGSVLVEGVLRAPAEVSRPLSDAAGGRSPIPVADGLVGAAVLALRRGGATVDAALHARLTDAVRA